MSIGAALAWRLAVQAPAEVQWQAPPECPDRAALQAAIERRLGRPLTQARVVAKVRRERSGYSLRLQLTVEGRGESRELHDASCAALTEAVALRVAAAIEAPAPVPVPPTLPEPPDADGGEIAGERCAEGSGAQGCEAVEDDAAQVGEQGGAQGSTGVTEVETQGAEASKGPITGTQGVKSQGARGVGAEEAALDSMGAGLAVPEDRSKRPGGVLRLHGGAELGAVPGVTGAVGLAGGLLWRRLRVELGGVYLGPRTAERAQANVRVQLFAGGVQACGRFGRGALEVPVCGGVEAGVMRGDGSGLPSARRAVSGWLAGVLGAGLVWHATRRFSVWSTLQLVLAPVRARFELSNASETRALFTPSAVSGRLLLGVELRISDPW